MTIAVYYFWDSREQNPENGDDKFEENFNFDEDSGDEDERAKRHRENTFNEVLQLIWKKD